MNKFFIMVLSLALAFLNPTSRPTPFDKRKLTYQEKKCYEACVNGNN